MFSTAAVTTATIAIAAMATMIDLRTSKQLQVATSKPLSATPKLLSQLAKALS